jgi:predicted nucleic acid-binding protein
VDGTEFLDTNILVYAYAPADPRKRQRAREVIEHALAGGAVISTQVLAEFAATLLHKSKEKPEIVLAILSALEPLRLIYPNAAIVQRAIEAHTRYGIHFYDGMIVAAAERAGCRRIWSEDLNSGQIYFGVKVENPFD